MNEIILYVDEYRDSSTLIKDGITFSNTKIVKLLIDGIDVEEDVNLFDAMIYFPELCLSYQNTGRYLIFTCANGIAMNGGWEGVDVIVDEYTINWSFEAGDTVYKYNFDKLEYILEIESVRSFLKENNELALEPSWIMFPEKWHR